MRQLSQRSGGRLFRIDLDLPAPQFVDGAHEVFERIEEDLRHRYVLTYYSGRPMTSRRLRTARGSCFCATA